MTVRCIALILLLLYAASSLDASPTPESVTATSPHPDNAKSANASTLPPKTTKHPDVSQMATTKPFENKSSTEENKVEEHQIMKITSKPGTENQTEENTTGKDNQIEENSTEKDNQTVKATPEPETTLSSSCSVNTTKTEVNDQSDDMKSLQTVVHSSNLLALNLYKIIKSEKSTVLISPLSLGVLLSMLWLGSAGKSANQIAQAFNFPENRSDVIQGFHALSQSLQTLKINNITLNVANKLYADNAFLLKEEFLSTIRSSFLADAELLNFVANSDSARSSINKWVEQQTQSHIKDLLQEGVINKDTKVVLVNAVYFKGLWKNQFMKEATRDAPFHLINGTIVSTPTMLAIGDFPTANMQHLNCTVIKLPYEGSISLMVFLPQSRQGLPTLEESLELKDIEEIIPKLENIDLHLYFPKFTSEFSTELEDAFNKLGIKDIFQTDADLSGISPHPGLSVTHILHKTFLEITEEGSEAGAASASVLDTRGGTLSINVDHPFMYAIYDDKTGTILFLGNYKGPE